MMEKLYQPPSTSPKITTIKTVVAESDGTNCPRGWYFLAWGKGILDDKPSAWGPFRNAGDAVRAQRKFLASLNLAEPVFSRDPEFLSRTGFLDNKGVRH